MDRGQKGVRPRGPRSSITAPDKRPIVGRLFFMVPWCVARAPVPDRFPFE